MQIFISLQKFKIPHIKTHIRVYMSSMVTYVNMLQLLWKKKIHLIWHGLIRLQKTIVVVLISPHAFKI